MYKFSASAANRHLGEVRSFVKYQNKRGGEAVLPTLASPSSTEFGNALKGMEIAQCYENAIYTELLKVHEVADAYSDYQVQTLP